MPNPYAGIPGPEVFLYVAGTLLTTVALIVLTVAWSFYSYRKMFGWYQSIAASKGRWESILLPPDDVTADIFGFLVVGAINLFLIATGLFITGWFVYVS